MKKIYLLFPVVFFLGCQAPVVSSIRNEPAVSVAPVQTTLAQIQNSRFTPESIEINAGESITIENLDNAIWTLESDPHPSHSENPNLYTILHKGESLDYTFGKRGSFGIHLEENPSINLKIVVK